MCLAWVLMKGSSGPDNGMCRPGIYRLARYLTQALCHQFRGLDKIAGLAFPPFSWLSLPSWGCECLGQPHGRRFSIAPTIGTIVIAVGVAVDKPPSTFAGSCFPVR